jgi:hypothetical protein
MISVIINKPMHLRCRSLKELGNPFMEESRDLLSLDTKDIVHANAAELIESHLEKGK